MRLGAVSVCVFETKTLVQRPEYAEGHHRQVPLSVVQVRRLPTQAIETAVFFLRVPLHVANALHQKMLLWQARLGSRPASLRWTPQDTGYL